MSSSRKKIRKFGGKICHIFLAKRPLPETCITPPSSLFVHCFPKTLAKLLQNNLRLKNKHFLCSWQKNVNFFLILIWFFSVIYYFYLCEFTPRCKILITFDFKKMSAIFGMDSICYLLSSSVFIFPLFLKCFISISLIIILICFPTIFFHLKSRITLTITITFIPTIFFWCECQYASFLPQSWNLLQAVLVIFY